MSNSYRKYSSVNTKRTITAKKRSNTNSYRETAISKINKVKRKYLKKEKATKRSRR